MGRITKPLTNTEVKQAKPKDKLYKLSDGGGLQLHVKPNGSKLWRLDYIRPYTKKRTCLSLGSYPSISLAEARKEREQAKELLAKNIDPQEHRNEQKKQFEAAFNNTLESIASQWLEVKKSSITEAHAKDTLSSLEKHIYPQLGMLPINKVSAVKTIEVLKPIEARGNLETVKRLCQRLNEIMDFAVNSGLLENNPLSGIRKAFRPPAKRHMPALTPSELPHLLQTLSRASIQLTTRLLIEWQLHTMTRPSEAAGARWDELDIPNAIWHIPAERMKRNKPHSIPLSSQCLTLLELAKQMSGKSDFVFPSDKDPRKPRNSQTANAALKRMGFKDQLVAHGMRSIASTLLNEEGFDHDVIEAALAHTGKNEVRNAYNRALYIERRKPLMQWWSNYIEKAASGNVSLAASNIYPLQRSG
ncbi:MAG: integrase [Kangiellaceae bacterium]|nr:integrase [Kangiellaceae bacterium]